MKQREFAEKVLLSDPHEDINLELARLRKENELLRQEHELLKKRRPSSLELRRIRKQSMKFAFIDAQEATMSLSRLCAFADISLSGYYIWKHRAPSRHQLDDMIILAHIRNHFALSRETYGSPRMHIELCEEGIVVGRHRTARLMCENGLKARQKTLSSAQQTVIIVNLSPQIFWIRISRVKHQIRNGALISVIYGRQKAGFIWPLLLTFIHAVLSAGKHVTG